MKKLIVLLLLSFCIISSNYVKAQCDIDPELQEILKQKSDELISINIILKSQIDVKKLNTRKQDFASKDIKREAALKEFKQFHQASQADVLSILQAETRSSNVKNVKSHWITNMINSLCKTQGEFIFMKKDNEYYKSFLSGFCVGCVLIDLASLFFSTEIK